MSVASPTREFQRIDAALRAERTGKKLPPLSDVIRPSSSAQGEDLPIEPFRAWLTDLIERDAPRVKKANDPGSKGLARQLRASTRRMHQWLHENEMVSFSTVDRAASRHGGTTVEEIYWTYGNGMTIKTLSNGRFGFVVYQWAAEEKVVVKTERRRTCRSSGCSENVEEGRFCEFHAAALARVKESLKQETAAFQSTIRRKSSYPTCCNKACREPRLRSERYCALCKEEGWDEGDLV